MIQEHNLNILISEEDISSFEAISGITLNKNLKLTIKCDTEKATYEFVELNDDIIVKNPSLTLTDGFITPDSLDLYG